LEKAGLVVLPLATDEGADLAAARRMLRELGLEARSGYVDGTARRVFEVLFIELLQQIGQVPEPSSLLLDSAGQWLVAYCGPVEIDTLLVDVALQAGVDPKNRRAAKMLGGRWALRSDRDWTTLANVFRELGQPSLSELYRARGATAEDR
jgi:hypothetical protein